MIDKINLSRRGLLRGAAALPAVQVFGTTNVASVVSKEAIAVAAPTAMIPKAVAILAASPSKARSFMERASNFFEIYPYFDTQKFSPDEIAKRIIESNPEAMNNGFLDATAFDTGRLHDDLSLQDLTLENIKMANQFVALSHWRFNKAEEERFASQAEKLAKLFANPKELRSYIDAVNKSMARYLLDNPAYLPPLGTRDRMDMLAKIETVGQLQGADIEKVKVMRDYSNRINKKIDLIERHRNKEKNKRELEAAYKEYDPFRA